MVHVFAVSSQPSFLEDGNIQRLSNAHAISIEKTFLLGGANGLPRGEELPCDRRTRAFQMVEEDISEFLQAHDIVHDRFVGILHFLDGGSHPDDIHALRRPEGALILAFPEVQWVPFWNDESGTPQPDTKGTMTLKRAWELTDGGYSPLFDGDGLRSCLMARIRADNGTRCERTDVALAVDEEANFAFMNAYAAYRFGYRSYPVTTLAAARVLLKDGKDGLPLASRFRNSTYSVPPSRTADFRARLMNPAVVVFEDVQLHFPDSEAGKEGIPAFGTRLDDKGELRWEKEEAPAFGAPRDEAWRLLQEADLRVVVTASRPEEAIAETQSDIHTTNDGKTRTTVEEYFQGRDKSYRALHGIDVLARLKCFRHQTAERSARWWFNASGGWAGHWLLKVLDAVVLVGLLIGLFFWKASLFLPVLFGLLVVRGGGYHGLQKLCVRKIGLPQGFRRMLVQWAQWRFLPKRYRNHCPENRIGNSSESYWTVTHKPLAGIFGLRNACSLPNGRGYQGLYDTARVMDEYSSMKCGDWGRRNDTITHAAPGMALEIAVRLLRRAERLVVEDKIIDAEGAVHGAVLATVAGELLDAKTPAVSIEALTWKQYFEIRAECEFVGVQAHTDMVDRYIDIHNAMGRICRSANGLVREDVFTSGMAELMDKLSSLLSEKGKREEALYFAKKARMFHRRLMTPMVRNLLAYPEWLLRSAWHVVASFTIIAVVFFAYWMVRIEPGCSAYKAFSRTYEVLVCDEPDLAWPGREEASWVVVNGPFPAGPDQGTPNIWEVQPTTEPKHIQTARKAAAVKKGKNGQQAGNPTRDGIPKETFSILVHTMRQIALLHLAFLGLCFWDAMRQK